jgi:hypothetical protein
MNHLPAVLAHHFAIRLVEEIPLRSVGADDSGIPVQEEDAVVDCVEDRIASENRIQRGAVDTRLPTT